MDLLCNKKIVTTDVNEKQILDAIKGRPAQIIVTPIGGQGFIFGRGNQQISPEVIRGVGKTNVIILATPNKLLSLGVGVPLRVDTGDAEIDEILSGYIRVITGYCEEAVIRVEP